MFWLQMLVPTVDTLRFSSMLELCLDVNRSVLFTGESRHAFGRL
jgi:dynein heavy chain